MIDLGPHAHFIVAAYAITVLAVGALIGWVIADFRRQQRILRDLEASGVTRRSARSPAPPASRKAVSP